MDQRTETDRSGMLIGRKYATSNVASLGADYSSAAGLQGAPDLRVPGTLVWSIHALLHAPSSQASQHSFGGLKSVMNQLHLRDSAESNGEPANEGEVSALLRSCSEQQEPLF